MKKAIKFYSETCSPCKLMGKRLSEVKNIEVQSVDIADDSSINLMDKYNIKSIPTIIILDNENILARFNGIVSTEEIDRIVNGREEISD